MSRLVSRADEWQARLDLLEALWRAARGDIVTALDSWATGTGIEGE